MSQAPMSVTIDPILFGALTQQVEQLERQVTSLQSDMRELLELANRSKGGFWVGMGCASLVGAVISWIAAHMKF